MQSSRAKGYLRRSPRDPSGEVADDFLLAPDLIVEVLSPGQAPRTLVEKVEFCLKEGTRLGWVIDPQRKQVTVLAAGRSPETVTAGELDLDPVLPGARLPLLELFGWLFPPLPPEGPLPPAEGLPPK